MSTQFTQEELNNMGLLIKKANITGNDALTVALLLQKISSLLTPSAQAEEKKTDEKGAKGK